MEKVLKVINDVITNPPIPHEPYKQSLKNWAKYCLQNKGFIVTYAQNYDFAVEVKGQGKLYFQVTDNAVDLDDKINWIVWDSAAKKASFIPQML
ncbi:MAG: hypothetical protein ACKO9I_03115 [Sphaerospermopsis kisseleviana]|jgi:hypothetical protein|uniref:Uncharacterized protein n=1 Tax=Sphaerospermopsis aphanizomenoides LEGE 00250 TaxID=2777972 RepID=A0ABR9VM82_9CYAN|nr:MULTISPECIES: hypothetical protein [Sphaerospermopsis]MBC5798330.1 hypothetical protein [Sphaerospermopsis sp. LEGE 00249]MBE9238530.1 hypothetical protein [Sphaerospermopsis aphanizomenoides LEGE 00250]MEB3149352.1 hypothetical protein [Sphaerospermopsis sp.]